MTNRVPANTSEASGCELAFLVGFSRSWIPTWTPVFHRQSSSVTLPPGSEIELLLCHRGWISHSCFFFSSPSGSPTERCHCHLGVACVWDQWALVKHSLFTVGSGDETKTRVRRGSSEWCHWRRRHDELFNGSVSTPCAQFVLGIAEWLCLSASWNVHLWIVSLEANSQTRAAAFFF